eukprot:TRINITY_DN73040_c0_g1_i1.p1 TRINITY_DN73040_c0_g1~~TRINITY_DN73040_c0_g1_i1.p1  ORF type:complete len:243 (+),score=71.03 TRINITY_DN73040_c0_g1_i1:62-730(+)
MKYQALTENEKILQLLIVAGTNAAGIPCAVRCFRHACFFEMWMGAGAVAVSVLYHTAEVWRQPLLGMTDGQWHRLDNVFAIMSFVSLMLFLMDNKNRAFDDFLRWGFIVLVTWAQERGPWILFYTVAPVVLAALLCLGKYVVTLSLPTYLKLPEQRRIFRNATATLAVSLYFFYKGLDETQDYLRLHHGLWHFFCSIAFYQYFALDVASKRAGVQAADSRKE